MTGSLRLRTLTLLVAVLLPFAQAHCAWMPLLASAVVVVPAHQQADADECCQESNSSPQTPPPVDPCCCAHLQLPAWSAPVSVSLFAPPSLPTFLAAVPGPVLSVLAGGVFLGSTPDARSGSPPGPSASPQSPRSPPHLA